MQHFGVCLFYSLHQTSLVRVQARKTSPMLLCYILFSPWRIFPSDNIAGVPLSRDSHTVADIAFSCFGKQVPEYLLRVVLSK